MALIAPFIGWAFGLLWLTVAIGATPGPWNGIAGAVGGVIALVVALRIWRRRGSRRGRFDWRWYLGAVITEVVLLMIAQKWLVAHHRADLGFPVVGVIVGLHFFGLWPAMGLRRFVALGLVLVAVNLAAMLLPLGDSGRLRLSGFGSSAALLLTAAA